MKLPEEDGAADAGFGFGFGFGFDFDFGFGLARRGGSATLMKPPAGAAGVGDFARRGGSATLIKPEVCMEVFSVSHARAC